jgi:hypothetical protein
VTTATDRDYERLIDGEHLEPASARPINPFGL